MANRTSNTGTALLSFTPSILLELCFYYSQFLLHILAWFLILKRLDIEMINGGFNLGFQAGDDLLVN